MLEVETQARFKKGSFEVQCEQHGSEEISSSHMGEKVSSSHMDARYKF